jgi:hypothetical protein
MNILNESLSIHVFQMRGTTSIPDNVKPDIDGESDAKTYSLGLNCLDIIFKRGDTLTLHDHVNDLTSRLAYIYSISKLCKKVTTD